MRLDADVIVVGAGPGGASAAYFLGAQGYKVFVFEKARLPRYKACGGGVPHSVFNFFPFSFEPVIEQRITQASFVWDGRQVTQPIAPDSLAMVMRDRFDHHILQHAQAQIYDGVEVAVVTQDADKVKVTTKTGSSFCAAYLIAADGANSVVAPAVGLRRSKQLGVAIEVETEVDGATLAVYQGRFLMGLDSVPRGYYWIFPKADHLSIGIGTLKRGVKTLPKLLEKAVGRFGITVKGQSHAHPLPICIRREPLQRGRVLLVGDAAGLMDPMTGEGIRHAIESAKIAADLILKNDVSLYTALIEKKCTTDLYWADLYAKIIFSRPHFSFNWLFRNRLAFPDAVRILSNQLTYRKAIARLPLYILNAANRLPVDEIF